LYTTDETTTNDQIGHSSHKQRISTTKFFTRAWQRLVTFSRAAFVFKHRTKTIYQYRKQALSTDSLVTVVNKEEKVDSTVAATSTTTSLDLCLFAPSNPMLLGFSSDRFESMSEQEQRAYVQACVDLSGLSSSLYL
jgi:hypothetical protein